MDRARWLLGLLVPLATSPLTSQPTPHDAQAAILVSSTADSPEIVNPELRPVQGELVDKLDLKTAKSGSVLVIRTTVSANTAEGVLIPKGSRLVGHVTDVKPQENGGEDAKLTLQFDKAEIKGGQTLSIRSVIEAVAPPGEATGNASNTYGMPIGGAAATDPTPDRSAAATRMVPAPTTLKSDSPASGVQNGQVRVGMVVSSNGGVIVRTTAIPGILLAENSDGQPFPDASGALLGSEQDLHLDGGTHFVIGVADAKSITKR